MDRVDQVISTPDAISLPPAAPQQNNDPAHPPIPAAAVQFVTEQPQDERLARVFLGADVQNAAGERVGDVHDILFDASGRISSVVLGVGGFLGIGEKIVAVPYGALTYSAERGGARLITVELDKNALMQAPAFHAIEKTILDSVRDKAADLGHRTADKAAELREQAARKILEMTKSTPAQP